MKQFKNDTCKYDEEDEVRKIRYGTKRVRGNSQHNLIVHFNTYNQFVKRGILFDYCIGCNTTIGRLRYE